MIATTWLSKLKTIVSCIAPNNGRETTALENKEADGQDKVSNIQCHQKIDTSSDFC